MTSQHTPPKKEGGGVAAVYMAGCFEAYETKNYYGGNASGVFTICSQQRITILSLIHMEEKIWKLF